MPVLVSSKGRCNVGGGVSMTVIVNTKVGECRGRTRVWLEGAKLSRYGIHPGCRYSVSSSNGRIVLNTDGGRYRVSQRKRGDRTLPVMDLTMAEIAATFHVHQLLRVTIRHGKITITEHHLNKAVQEREERIVGKLRSGEPLTVASFFTGFGVLDLAVHTGFARSGISSGVRMAVECEQKYLDVGLRNNASIWGQDPYIYESKIEHVPTDDFYPAAEILIAGVPCTGASRAGISKNKLQNAEDHTTAGAAFYWTLRLLEQLNPAVFIMENVPEYLRTASMSVIRSVLDTLGYELTERVMSGNEFGALENRSRAVVVAISKGLSGFDLDDVVSLYEKAADMSCALDPVADDSALWRPYEYLAAKEESDKAAGKGFRRQILNGAAERCGTIGRGYAKGRSTEPLLAHPRQHGLFRQLTPAEHCRVKRIPESLIRSECATTAHEGVGQSVIFSVFESMAASLGKWLKEAAESWFLAWRVVA